MVKNEDEIKDLAEEVREFEIKAEVVADQIKSVLTFIGTGVLTYVLADTVRQVAIERAKK
jgi:hypothetical protein